MAKSNVPSLLCCPVFLKAKTRTGGKMTVAQLYRQSRKLLSHESADFDLSQLFYAQFGRKAGLINNDELVNADDAFIFTRKVKRLADGYPLQYLLGEWEFFSIPLKVGEGVLIPRADTETVVEAAISMLSGIQTPVVADLCAGSGAISLALAANVPNITVHSVELYDAAMEYLQANVSQCNFSEIIEIHQQDVLTSITLPPLDMIVSNPPYLTIEEMQQLSPQVKCEPETALLGGDDGLMFYRSITKSAPFLLNKSGSLVFECGYQQAADIKYLMEQEGFVNVRIIKDLGGNDRCVTGVLGDAKPLI